jgi:hypothetical protein
MVRVGQQGDCDLLFGCHGFGSCCFVAAWMPSDNHEGNHPGGSSGEVSNQAAMKKQRASRAGSAQRNQTNNYPHTMMMIEMFIPCFF